MKYLTLIMALLFLKSDYVVFDFNKKSNLTDWIILDDVVMGGRSSGTIEIDDNGNGVYSGSVSLQNNGGFSSLRYKMARLSVKKYNKIKLKVKGDGKNFQLRIKVNSEDYYSYISQFSTNKEWQEIEIPLKDMFPSFRGRKLDLPNFSGEFIEELTFLIGNKKQEEFKLLIDKIELI